MRPFQAIGSLEGEFEVVRLKVFEDLIGSPLKKRGLFDESKEKFVDPLRYKILFRWWFC